MPKTNYYGITYFVNFGDNLSRTQKVHINQEIENICGIVIGKLSGKHMTFFVPVSKLNDVLDLKNYIAKQGGTIAGHTVENNAENKEFIKLRAIEFIVKRVDELEALKTNVLIFAQRTTKFKNITLEYLKLREYGNVYHELLGINNQPIERRVIEASNQISRYYDAMGLIG